MQENILCPLLPGPESGIAEFLSMRDSVETQLITFALKITEHVFNMVVSRLQQVIIVMKLCSRQ
jgi:hypothetical protein